MYSIINSKYNHLLFLLIVVKEMILTKHSCRDSKEVFQRGKLNQIMQPITIKYILSLYDSSGYKEQLQQTPRFYLA